MQPRRDLKISVLTARALGGLVSKLSDQRIQSLGLVSQRGCRSGNLTRGAGVLFGQRPPGSELLIRFTRRLGRKLRAFLFHCCHKVCLTTYAGAVFCIYFNNAERDSGLYHPNPAKCPESTLRLATWRAGIATA